MVRSVRWLGVAMVGCVALGCLPKKPPPQDNSQSDAATVPTATATTDDTPQSGPANDTQVTHYPDQTPASNIPVTTHIATQARSEASSVNGKLIAHLKAGTAAEKLADHDGFDLVLFADPLDATRKIEGWVPAGAFAGWVAHYDGSAPPPAHTSDAAAPPHAARPLDVKKTGGTCPAGYSTCGAICRLSCRADGDCGVATAHCVGGQCLGPGAVPCAH